MLTFTLSLIKASASFAAETKIICQDQAKQAVNDLRKEMGDREASSLVTRFSIPYVTGDNRLFLNVNVEATGDFYGPTYYWVYLNPNNCEIVSTVLIPKM